MDMVAQAIELGKKPHVIVATPVSLTLPFAADSNGNRSHSTRVGYWIILKRRRASA